MLCSNSYAIVDASASLADKSWEENYYASNVVIERFTDYFTTWTGTDAETNYPDYFSGFRLGDDARLTVYVTSLDEDIISDVCAISGVTEKDIKFEQRAYSFNELDRIFCGIQKLMACKNDSGIHSISINLSGNCVDVKYDESVATSEEILKAIEGSRGTLFNEARAENFQEVKDHLNLVKYSDDLSLDALSVTVEDDNCFDAEYCEGENAELQAVTTTILPGGPGGPSYNLRSGTIGFCALGYNGEKLLITHGHGLPVGTSYYYGATYVGSVVYQKGSDTPEEPLDFSVIKLSDSSSIGLSNRVYFTSSYLNSGFSTDTSLKAVENLYAYTRGSASGTELLGKLVYTYNGSSYILMLSTENITIPGDSGAPIYTKTSSTSFKLVGIVETGKEHTGTYGVSLPAIKNAYSMFVYYNNEVYS